MAFANDQWRAGTDIRNLGDERRNEMQEVHDMDVTLWGDKKGGHDLAFHYNGLDGKATA